MTGQGKVAGMRNQQAAARIEELEAEVKRLRDGIEAHRQKESKPWRDSRRADDELWSLLDAR